MIELRPITAAEGLASATLRGRAFRGRGPTGAQERAATSLPADHLARTLGVFEAGGLVATSRSFATRLTLPGPGWVEAGAVSGIAVLPTHRRRGLLRLIMRRLLDEMRDRGEAVSLLYASEGPIYGRFGYGVGTYQCHLHVARSRNAFLGSVPTDGLRMIEPAAAIEQLAAIAAAATSAQPGAVTADAERWRFLVEERPATSPDLQVVTRASGDGFAAYEADVDFDLSTLAGGTLRLHFLFAHNREAYAALWRHCLDVDLINQVEALGRSADEPLRHMLADPRGLQTVVMDGLWVRLVDVQAALSARLYAGDGSVVLQVEDEFCPWNVGAYEVGPAGCRRVAGEPELAMGIETLSACYLGGNRFSAMERAGRITELVPGAAGRADGLFASPIAPWCPYHF
jgi:predicted acetyltransferase